MRNRRRAASLAHALAAALLAMVGLATVPAAATAAPLIAAFEHYVPGQGFDIGLINATTGASIAVPSGVNTDKDEFHPALTPNGRVLVFTRATLVAQPDGDVVPPATREAILKDRQTGDPSPPPTSWAAAAREVRARPSCRQAVS